MAVVDLAVLKRLAQCVLGESLASREWQLANIEQKIDLMRLEDAQEIAEIGAFVAEGE